MQNSQRTISITDLLIETLIPVLAIGLIWSLVVFAISVKGIFYPGQEQTLRWVFFLYVMGTVMANRIAGLYGESEKASLYSIALVSVMALFALTFSARYGAISGGTGPGEGLLANIAIVAIVGLASYKICREACYDIKDIEKEKSDIQLRAEVRAQQDWYRREQALDARKKQKPEVERQDVVRKPSRLPEKHPGIWIIYFSIFSMIAFGVGQRVLPEDSWALYAQAFHCLLANVACALGLLLLTTLSAVRFNCWKRRALIPAGVGRFWTATGAALILIVMSLASLPPRPVPKYLVRSAIPAYESTTPEKDEENKEEAKSSETWGSQTSQIETQLEKEERDAEKMRKEQGPGEDAGEGSTGGEKDSGKSSEGEAAAGGSGSAGASPQKKSATTRARYAPPRPAPLPTPPLQGLEKLGRLVFAVLLAFSLLWGIVKVIAFIGEANALGLISNRLRNLAGRLRSLFRRRKRLRLSAEKVEAALKEENLYMENPFRSGHLLNQMSKAELVKYTYKAFENYAHVQGHTPLSGQTPAEFVKSLPEELQLQEFSDLLKMFLLAEYSTHAVPEKSLEKLKQVWARIES